MSALDRLMEHVGIEPGFQDAGGALRETDPAVALELLKAFGFHVEDEAGARTALQRLEAEEAQRPLPPAVVTTRPGAPVSVPLGTSLAGKRLQWKTIGEGAARSADWAEGEVISAPGDAPSGRRLVFEAPESFGRYRLQVGNEGAALAETVLIVAPERCRLPQELTEGRSLWGISIQLYLLRSQRNWGIGDFGDLRRFVRIAADLGAAVVGLNPLHASFLDDPEHASPYSPASRLFLNPLYIDLTAVPGFADAPEVRSLVDSPDFRTDLAAVRRAGLVDYAGVARLKLPVLEALHRHFRHEATKEDRAALADFRDAQGEALECFCRYQALRERFAAESPERADWRRWPAAYRDSASPDVERFAGEHPERIAFFAWLQWTADRQLGEAAAAAAAGGMEIGLYRDLAVGADGGGAEGWANPATVVSSVHVGAPPDILNPAGQDWALPPFNPHALHEEAYASFAELVRANMRHAGGLRIDHVMALQHLYMIPEGRPATEGAYVAYPLDEMTAVLALESHRSGCLVVGEDLGTVPEGFRDRMEAAAILSYRVVVFEQDEEGAFVPPQDYPPLALAVLGSHDLAPLRGWWEGRDLDLKARYDLYPTAGEEAHQRAERDRERAAFIAALTAAGLLDEKELSAQAPFSPRLAEAAHGFLARTASGIAVAQLEDLLGEAEQVNLPGVAEGHPNWRRRHEVPIEALAEDRRLRRLAAILGDRPRRAGQD